MFKIRRSAFQKEIDSLLNNENSSKNGLFLASKLPVRTMADAENVCSALDRIHNQKTGSSIDLDSLLHSLVAYFQDVESDEAFQVLTDKGLPKLRVWITDLLKNESRNIYVVLFMLKILALYRQQEDVELIARIARQRVGEDEYIWSTILGCFDGQHPFSVAMIDALREPLPTGFILVSYLDMANAVAIAGRSFAHPFDTVKGRAWLEAWLSDTDENNFSYAISSAVALTFIESSARSKLMKMAFEHPDQKVRLETAWAQARSGDLAGIDRLIEYSLDLNKSLIAQQYLEELGFGGRIPSEAKEQNFRAMAEMANWLAYPTEYGRPPDEIEVFDSRELFWPPTNDRREVYLISYSYLSDENGEPDRVVGMVGSSTFCLFGETTSEMSAEDIYGCHCAWELEMDGDSRAPKVRSAESGRAIISEYNKGFA